MKSWISKFLSQFRFRKVRSRFLVAMIALSLPPLFILGYISFNIAKETLMETNTQTNEDHLRTSSEVADLLFRNIINLNRLIVVNSEIRKDLRESEIIDSLEQKDMSERTANRLQKLINNNLLDTRFVNSICLFDLNFQTFCFGRSDDAGIYEKSDKSAAIQQSEWYQRTFNAQGRVVFFGYNVLGDSPNSFSTVKLFRDSDSPTGEPIGLLIVNVSKSIFGSIFNESGNYDGFMALDSSQDGINIVYPQRSSTIQIPVGGNLEAAFNQLRQEGYLLSKYRNQTTNWTFVHLIKVQELLKQSNKIGSVTAVIASTIALVALIISYFISGSITRPLLQIKKMMVDWTKGRRDFTESFKKDEVGAIGETFKRMASENQELNEKLVRSVLKEREAELRALQAQIKPHFLYNTLDSIYWMATLEKNHEVAQMAISLSESFKLSLNKGKETIAVFKELKHVEHYMTIQNIRYHNRFQYYEEVDASIMGMEILKLLLQPLVENAIYHGLEPKVGEGFIRLTGNRDGDFLLFVVEDNGVGIEDLQVTEQGYGLRNVRERLMLYYGPSSSFVILSEANRGTKIEIRFKPFHEKEDTDA